MIEKLERNLGLLLFLCERKDVSDVKRVIIKVGGLMKTDDLDRITEDFKKQINDNGFIVIDDRVEVIEFDDNKLIISPEG